MFDIFSVALVVNAVTGVLRRLLWVALFSLAFGYVEASVVVYLRSLYYPAGFSFPLRVIAPGHQVVEIVREAATMIMLIAVARLAGSRGWTRLGFFCVAFGVWDIAFYAWLWLILRWPATVLDWDILFLIPVPWIGPVIAPLLLSLLLIGCGTLMVLRVAAGKPFRPRLLSWTLAVAGMALILLSFMIDTDATLRGALPKPYHGEMLAASLLLAIGGYVAACMPARPIRR
jgi:hypothetical protein